MTVRRSGVVRFKGRYVMMKSLGLMGLVLALAAGTAAAQDPPPAAAKPAETAKDPGGASAEVKVGTGVEKHEITGEAATFPAGTTVWVWSSVNHAEGNIKHVWKLDGKEVWTATLAVGSKKWSTQSRRAITKPGSWTVDVQTEAGAPLGTVSFTVQ
jgi:hypothetical protein